MDFRLKAFRSAAKNLSFTKASRELFISQPAVTKHIQALESEYGVRLFNRSGNKLHLTPAGKAMLKYADEVHKQHSVLQDSLNQYKENKGGVIRLGASTTIAQYVIPPILAGYHDRYPGIKLTLLTGNSEQVADALIGGEIDLGIVEGKIKSREIKYQKFMQDELVAAVRTKNNLGIKNEITLNQLVKLPLVLRERGSGTLEVFEHTLKNKGIKLSDLNIQMFLGSTEAIKLYLASVDCIGFISFRALQRELESGELKMIKIKNFKAPRTFEFICPQGSVQSGITADFIKYARK